MNYFDLVVYPVDKDGERVDDAEIQLHQIETHMDADQVNECVDIALRLVAKVMKVIRGF